MTQSFNGPSSAVPCCPEFGDDCPCDSLDFHYRLIHNTTVQVNDRTQVVPVEVKIHVRWERCPGPMALGELAYSTTLLPGERVRLFTADRRSRFTFDSESKISYRHEQMAEEQYYMASMHDFMSDVTVRDKGSASAQSQGSWSFDSSAAYGTIGFAGGASVNASGSHNGSSSREFVRELSQHVSASDRRSVTMTRAANSVQVGEVQSRTHAEGESEDHFEASSRVFSNPNRCQAVTFYFYRINKTQTVRLTIESIERRVIDPAAPTEVTNNPPRLTGGVSVTPTAVLATDSKRVEVEATGRSSIAAQQTSAVSSLGGAQFGGLAAAQFVSARAPVFEPISTHVREHALQQVGQDLVAAGLLDQPGPAGRVTPETQREFSFERCISLPTPGLLVKGCLDDCNICEPALLREIELDLARKDLANELFAKQIELLEKSQEYRCCPAGSEEEG